MEQACDEILHLKIANAVNDHTYFLHIALATVYLMPRPVLALITGDGALSQFNTSFVDQAKRALDRGWVVEVYSWRAALSSAWKRLRKEYPGRVLIVDLDNHVKSITRNEN
eukprot:TRINITY_DN8738_c0_g1_i6.p1 TRINITY_DN8738_c0_g1~~TRINITY_DN8738_c0_g1_i6.p1  ORF type:complete len:111 (-),score=22.52 TRINITY_DN8738_c0_g1_i6:2-334(-)